MTELHKSSHVINVKNLSKSFQISVKANNNVLSKLTNFLFPKYKDFLALNDINFSVQKGERIALLGPNGAGKSTLIKILTGIIRPSKGDVEIFGLNPIQNRKKICLHLGAIFGHISQLWQQLYVIDSLRLISSIYGVDNKTFKERIDFLTQIFDIGEILPKKVRILSLGQRMRCENYS